MSLQVFLSERAQRDLNAFSNKIAHQILADCTRLADNPTGWKTDQEVAGF